MMRLCRCALVFTTGLAITLPAPLRADDTAAGLGQLGRDFCVLSFSGEYKQFDPGDFRIALEAGGRSVTEFCACVGEGFRRDGDAETLSDLTAEVIADEDYFSMNFMLFDQMSQCLAEDTGSGLDLGLSDEDLAFDLAADMAAAEADIDGDVHMCNLAFEDALYTPGFDPQAARASMQGNQRSQARVCACAAARIKALGPEFEAEVETADNPQRIYGSALAGSIEQCLAP